MWKGVTNFFTSILGTPIEKYQVAVDTCSSLPTVPNTTSAVFTDGTTLPSMKDERHPYMVLFGLPSSKWPSSLPRPRKIPGMNSDGIEVCRRKTRKVMIETEDEPTAKINELHPYKLDFAENRPVENFRDVQAENNRLMVQPPKSVPSKRRNVGFEVDKYPSALSSEEHPYKLDFGCSLSNVAQITSMQIDPCDVLPKNSRAVCFESDIDPPVATAELHPYKLDFGENLANKRKDLFFNMYTVPMYRHWTITFAPGTETISDKTEKQWMRKKVHFTIVSGSLAARYKPGKCYIRHRRLPPSICKRKGISGHFATEYLHQTQLHDSIVLASHIYWTLLDMTTIPSYEDPAQFEDEIERIRCLDEVLLPRYYEEHPMKHACKSPNAGLLKEGCPAVGRLNKKPTIVITKEPPWKRQDDGNEKCTVTMSEECLVPEVDSPIDKDHIGCAKTQDQLAVDAASNENTLQSDETESRPESGSGTGSNEMGKQCKELPTCEDDSSITPTPSNVDETSEIHLEKHKLLVSSHSARSMLSHSKKQQKQCVLVCFNAVIDMTIIRSYLAQLLEVPFSFVILECQTTDENTTVSHLEFSSKGSARRFTELLNKMKSDTGCSARLSDYERRDETSATFVKNEWSKLLKEMQNTLSSHRAKIDSLEKKISGSSTRKKIQMHELDKILGEKQAYKQKLTELRGQEQEFHQFLGIFENAFNNISQYLDVKAEVARMKLHMSIEKDRIEAALPMYAKRKEIVEMVAHNQVSIVLGETGSGKSTQMTQYLYEAGLAEKGCIVCTQPRKVAATSLAKRVAQEMHTKVGQTVGFKVGMQENISRETAIIYMTDHMLLKECLVDSSLTKYSCIIIDEAHERSLYTDLLLGMIKKKLSQRRDLRLIITSATIDPDIFVRYFCGCPVLKVSGRVFPVDVIYSDVPVSPDGDFVQQAVLKAIQLAVGEEPGDILVFLTTPLETERASDGAKRQWKGDQSKLISLALHGKTQGNDQQKVFDETPKGKRKIVFATNSAETSITIPGIKYVVDTGLVKEKVYDPSKNMSALKVTKVSKSSANQRKGRAGRTASGKCYRLYTEEDYGAMEESSKPEILRVHLGMAILQLLALSIEDPLSFDFVEAPPRIALEKAAEVLNYLGALESGKLTALGHKLAKLSLEPRLGKLLLRGVEEGIGYEAILVASFSTMGGNMFYRGGSNEQKEESDKLKVRFSHSHGDFHTMLNVFKEWVLIPEREKVTWCMENSINAKSMRMARDSLKELLNTLEKDMRIKVKQRFAKEGSADDTLDAIILECFATNVCLYTGHDQTGYFVVNEDERVLHIHPSSALMSLGKSPELLVFENTLTTSRDFMINVTCITRETLQSFNQKSTIHIDLAPSEAKVGFPCKISNIGKSVVRNLIGIRHSNRKSLEKELQSFCNTDILAFDANVQDGFVSISVRRECHEEIEQVLTDVIEKERALLALEEIERPLTERCGVRAIIGHGGRIKHLLFPDEFRTIRIHSIPDHTTAEHVMECFREFGIVSDFDTNTTKEGQTWLKIIFQHPDVASLAIEALNDGYFDEFQMSAKPDMTGAGGIAAPRPPEMQVKLMWCRRPSKGFAFVKFPNMPNRQPTLAEDVTMSMGLIGFGGSRLRVSLSKKSKEELFVRDVPKDSLQGELVRAIKRSISDETGIDASDVVIPRETIQQPTSDSEINQFKRLIESRIYNMLDIEPAMRIYIPVPREKTMEYVAFISISDPLIAERICNALTGALIAGNRVHAKLNLESSIMVQENVYPYVEDKVEEVVDELKDQFPDSFHIQMKIMKNGNSLISIKAESFECMTAVRKALSDSVAGKQIEILESRHLSHFLTKRGQEFLHKTKQKTQVYIHVDVYNSSLLLFGANRNVQRAEQKILQHINLIKELYTKSFQLKDTYPPGMVKLLMAKYGLDLECMVDDTCAEYVELKLRYHTLTVQGTPESLSNTEKLLDCLAQSLAEKARLQKDSEMPDCGVCFCPIDPDDVYRLENCGHPFCKECIGNLFRHSIKDKSFPITCAVEECHKEIVVKDIFNVIGQGMSQLAPLIQSAIDQYVLAHKDNLKYCVTPGCNMVYKVSDEMKVELCGICTVRICTRCQCQFHEGMTCDMYQSMKDGSYDRNVIETWLAGDRENRKLCPNCACGIEKTEGCNHMSCSKCRAHFCWICLEKFDDSQSTYAHLMKKHGDIF